MNTEITAGDPVEFNSGYGPLTGTLIGILRNISNAQQCAVIEVDHPLPGCIQAVPLHEVAKRVPPGHTAQTVSR